VFDELLFHFTLIYFQECETPVAPVNGSVNADGEIVTFSCNTGFTMSGDSTGTCNNDGTGWSIATPQCGMCDYTFKTL
jgi:hypothetical protein